MPTPITEKTLSIEFGDEWECLKWDDSPYYRQGIERVDGTKGVDIVAIRKDHRDVDVLYLIEIKDFRGHRIENKHKFSRRAVPSNPDALRCEDCGHQSQTRSCPEYHRSLAIDIARKVRDTLAGISGAVVSPRSVQFAHRCMAVVARGDAANIRVVAWVLEDEISGVGEHKQKMYQNESRKSLQNLLAWLTNKVSQIDPRHRLPDGVKLVNLKSPE